ncbi:MAG: 50S ribosomal protein L32e [Thermoplasmata archaeon M11B2D]|nr:MAG: 50S ribosomal protein L32e [Thermoplasmata archaeon M11B2D]PNX53461.1 MAG: 50S ribosomal protein L32e [Thermoplasmata archaeon M9B2D]
MTKEEVLKEFESLKGIGKVKAKLLYDNGFDSLDALKKAKVKDLTKLKGITEKNAKEILDQAKEKTKKTVEKKDQEKLQGKKEDAVEIIEQQKGAYRSKIKPRLNEKEKEQLAIRRQIKKRTPYFLRDEGFRYKRIPKNWRRPSGITSKLRINLKYRPSKVRVGFRSPTLVRGLHSSGFEEVMVHTVKELEKVDPKKQAVRIGGTVGTKKRLEIAKRADELDIRVLNMRE